MFFKLAAKVHWSTTLIVCKKKHDCLILFIILVLFDVFLRTVRKCPGVLLTSKNHFENKIIKPFYWLIFQFKKFLTNRMTWFRFFFCWSNVWFKCILSTYSFNNNLLTHSVKTFAKVNQNTWIYFGDFGELWGKLYPKRLQSLISVLCHVNQKNLI